ncbi:alpha-1,4-glucan--maltose-1-phosphate maltosyltransferase, partial [Stella sp.]|uniref:alpha-1,4-glucan--maltose-1-phosphate maltosyltransferase n=1 Tax=Stella sp. TaxID=2912054 RepID=UPI0035B4ADEB
RAFGPVRPLAAARSPVLAPAQVRLGAGDAASAVARRPPPGRASARAAAARPRIAVERVSPAVDGGRFAAKAVAGEEIPVEADIFADGHERLAAAVLWRPADAEEWFRAPMRPVGNDRWRAEILVDRPGRWLFTVEAWWDEFGSFRHELEAKLKAGRDVALEIAEGRLLVEEAAERAAGDGAAVLAETLERLDRNPTGPDPLLSGATRAAVAGAEARSFVVRHDPPLPIAVERPQAAFAAWYELFPRSATDDPARHGTFDDVIRRLPAIRRMGFDVLYFPPIHPIGRTNRKGRNNSLTARPGDVGSPYAIGGAEGGHDAVHPALGTIDDFRRLVAAAAAEGLEIALDFAIQCSPDHPWLNAHPQWFRWRPDGSLRFAENPPKKYEDIVNVDFYAEAAIPGLWLALRDVVLFWAGEGVRTFRVDNPHTKPLPFWEWLIADVQARHPDVLFLSEAFTRPKMMNRLAKLGFSQSYTYFTWRNSKAELTEYLTELSRGEARDFFRPHFFVNTPDINPVFLQTSGRPGFLIRSALAATLSGLWGVYSGFELCEAAPLPGREEYLDSEKYEIRPRPERAPGDIVDEITRLNRIRRAHPALHDHRKLAFYNAFDDRVLAYGRQAEPLGEMVLVLVSLDPHAAVEVEFELPLWEWGLPDHGSLAVTDLMRERSFLATGKRQRVRLDPADLPFAIWRLAPPGTAAP